MLITKGAAMCVKLRRSAMIVTMALTVFTASVISQVRPVLAAGSISLTVDKPDGAAVGDSVSVSYEAVSDGAAGDTSQVTIEYDPNRLELTGADKEYSGGGGNAVFAELSAVLTFTALSGGDAVINASAVINGDEADVPTASATVSVAGEDTAAALSGAQGDFSTMGVAAQTIPSPDGSVMVSTVFPNEYMPASFHKSTTLYQGTETECAKFDMGDMELLYTTDAAGQNGGFKVFNEGTGELSDFKLINGPEDHYIIILKADDTVIPPAGYIKATLQWNGQNFEAYMKVDETAETQNTDFFLVYAVSSEGNTGWYMYDQVEGTYQRFVMDDSLFEEKEESGEFNFLELPVPVYVIMGVLGLLCLIFLVIMIISLVRLREYESYEYIDEDEEPSAQPARQKGQTGRIPLSDASEAKAMRGEIRDLGEDGMFDPRTKQKEKKAKDKAGKKEKKKAGDKNTTGSLDFEAMESAMKSEDSRRPKGVENRYMQEANPPVQPVNQPQAGGPLRQAVLGPESEALKPAKQQTKAATKTVQQTARPAAPAAPAPKPAIPAAPAKNTGAVNGAEKPLNKEVKEQTAKPDKDNKQSVKAAETKSKAAVQKTPQLTEQQKEDMKRQELLNAARKPELKPEEDAYSSQQYYAQDYQGQYYDPAGGYTDPQYGQGYSGQYAQNGYYQDGYQMYQYNDQYGYGQEQQYGYYEPVPSAPQYNTEQFGNAQYELQYGSGYQYGNAGYTSEQSTQYQSTGGNAQPAQNYNSVDMDDDDDFEFEFINMN